MFWFLYKSYAYYSLCYRFGCTIHFPHLVRRWKQLVPPHSWLNIRLISYWKAKFMIYHGSQVQPQKMACTQQQVRIDILKVVFLWSAYTSMSRETTSSQFLQSCLFMWSAFPRYLIDRKGIKKSVKKGPVWDFLLPPTYCTRCDVVLLVFFSRLLNFLVGLQKVNICLLSQLST